MESFKQSMLALQTSVELFYAEIFLYRIVPWSITDLDVLKVNNILRLIALA